MKVLAVVQRYGKEVVGGSEAHARAMVGRLGLRHDVEVATTTAVDHWTWAEWYRAGDDSVDGVRVRRFAVASGRDEEFKAFERRVLFEEHSLEDELDWPRRQGPHSPALLEFLHRHGEDYDAVLFWTYIYEPTVLGVPLVPERAALIPTAHDELPIRLAPYDALFRLPRAFGFLTPEERDLVHGRYRNEHIPNVLLGTGLDPAPEADAAAFRARRGISGPLAVYVGQVSEAKGVDELVAAWERVDPAVTLVLIGAPGMAIAPRENVRPIGRTSDEEKWAALRAADVLILPSRLESLGIVLLEAWQAGTPVLVQRDNPVTRGQVARSGGGLAYGDDLPEALAGVLADGRAMGEAGRAWVERECSWPAVDERLEWLAQEAAAGV
ncbi:MAG TPA: glycosyltransferase family 4 protein [Candidatus Limnocylindria bacterium]|nr:glycosyltransferase family 4 protein [Candidatus Limnocylindria bacterium]